MKPGMPKMAGPLFLVLLQEGFGFEKFVSFDELALTLGVTTIQSLSLAQSKLSGSSTGNGTNLGPRTKIYVG